MELIIEHEKNQRFIDMHQQSFNVVGSLLEIRPIRCNKVGNTNSHTIMFDLENDSEIKFTGGCRRETPSYL